MIISVTSGKGSPGASAMVLGMTLTWPRPVLLLEADPVGGSLVLGYAAGAEIEGRNLTGVRVAARRSGMVDAIWANVVTLGEDRWLLPGVETTREAESVDYSAVASVLGNLGVDVIIDAGRSPAPVRHHALLAAADVVLVAMRSTLPAVHSAQAAAAAASETMGAAVPALQSIIIGSGRPYSERDIRDAMADVAPVVGVLAWDPVSAGALVDALPAPRSMATKPLLRSAVKLAKALAQQSEPGQAGNHSASGTAEHMQSAPGLPAPGLTGEAASAPAYRESLAVTARHSSHTTVAATLRTGDPS